VKVNINFGDVMPLKILLEAILKEIKLLRKDLKK